MDEGLKIVEISYQADGRVLAASLDDGSELFFDAHDKAASLAEQYLKSGNPLDGGAVETFRLADEIHRCRRKAMDLLARAEQCRRGMEAKLGKKGWSRQAVTAALDRLEDRGFLDDSRFAEAWVRSRMRSRPEGASRLIGGLMAKGVSGDIARNSVHAVLLELGDESGDQALERAWEKLSRRPGISDEKLIAALMRRGFQSAQVRALVRGRKEPREADSDE